MKSNRLFGRNQRTRRSTARAHLGVELLEDRCLLNGLGIPGGVDLSQLKTDPNAYDAASILVRFRGEDAGPGTVRALLPGTEVGRPISLVPGLREVRLGDGVNVAAALAAYRADPQVLYAEPNYRMHVAAVPNDPFYASQWSLDNSGQTGGIPDADIDAPEAWNVTQGNSDIIVAVIDTGIDYYHPDLAANIWTNAGEMGKDANGKDKSTNGVDDDGNGYVDDVRGWDFANHDNNPMDDGDGQITGGHGTYVASVIGANGNNGIGGAGVTWNVRLMPLKVFGNNGSATDADVIAALNYAVANGAKISNNSYGGYYGADFPQALFDAVQNATTAGHLFVAAAGNYGSDNDAQPFYPASFQPVPDNLIAVAAMDSTDHSAWNYGATSVDLAAPGVQVTNPLSGETYPGLSGTSFATPHVAGAAALVWAANPSLTAAQVKSLLLGNTDDISALNPGRPTQTNGRRNVDRAVRAALPADPPPAISLTSPADNATVSGAVIVSASASTDATRVEFFVDGASIGVDSKPGDGWSLSWNTTALADGRHRVTVAAFDAAGQRTSDAVSVFTRNSLPTAPTGWSTYLGGSMLDEPSALVVDAAGNTYVTGWTNSADFPATGGKYLPDRYGQYLHDGFVAKFRPDGTRAWAVYLGGTSEDKPHAIAVDPSGNVYVAGETSSTDFPTTRGAYHRKLTSGGSAFVTKLDGSSGTIIYATYLGGTDSAQAQGIAVDGAGNAYVTGGAGVNFPTTPGAFQRTGGGVFVAKLNPAGSGLVYSTFVGASGRGLAITVDSAGNAYLTGDTSASSFPTTSGAFQTSYGGGDLDAFLTELNPTGSGLIYSTFLGGTAWDDATGIARDGAGNVYITGTTRSANFPTSAGAPATRLSGGTDAFVTKFSPGYSTLVYSTYLGGTRNEDGIGITADNSGNAYVLSSTYSSDLPTTTGAFQPMLLGAADAAVTKLSADGRSLIYSTYLGGSSGDAFYGFNTGGVGLDGLGGVHVAGLTASPDFPTTPGAFQTSSNGADVFVTALGPDGNLFPIAPPAPQIRISDVSGPEGNKGTTPFVFTVSLSAASTQSISISYATQDYTAYAGNKDYRAANGTLTFNPGETSKTITVLVNGDTTVEPDERFFVNLSTTTRYASLVDSQGVATILNDDGAVAAAGADATGNLAALPLDLADALQVVAPTVAAEPSAAATPSRAVPALDRASADWLFAAIAEDRTSPAPHSKVHAWGEETEAWLEPLDPDALLLDGTLAPGPRR
jgi:subtilisin family serine protease